MGDIRTIGILTSGGDSPGMNAAVRAVVRTAKYHNCNVVGIKKGYQGMIQNEMIPLEARSVAGIINRGGTFLKTARCPEFYTKEGRQKAYENLVANNIDGLILIGGNGTFTGAVELFKEHNIPAIGIPGTIDNDLSGTDFTIGFDTAVNTAMEAIDKIRDTALAHERVFVVEVMGRDAGYIALYSGLATGAEEIIIPESPTSFERIVESIDWDIKRMKNVRIIIVAEGDEFGGATLVAQKIKEERPQLDVKLAILGHIQRGGSPSCADRVLASRLGYASVNALLNGESQVMVGVVNGKLQYTPFTDAIELHKPFDKDYLDMVKVLSI